ncbi:MAG: LacI family DNA-binding transcriptional regulator [Lentisphaeria bacterium]
MATLRDIAHEAKVSIQTVSNILNDYNPGSYGAAVGKRVRAIAKRLDYRPNCTARAMRTRKTNIIGLLVWGMADLSTAKVVDTFEQALHRHGRRLMLGISGSIAKTAATEYLRDFQAGMMDGIINADSFLEADLVIKALRPRPVLTFNRAHPSCPARINYVQQMETAMGHLLGLGHRRLGFLHGPVWDPIPQTQIATYHSILQRHGITPPPEWLADTHWEPDNAERLTPPLLAAGCTAILCANDWFAVRAIRVARRAGLRVPEDVSIIGADDLPIARVSDPELTTLRFPYEAMAEKHVDAMLALLQGQPMPPAALLEHDLVIRGSTAPPPPVSPRAKRRKHP